MKTLDQKIVIPVAPFYIWEWISDLARNPSWQTDCESISFLTTLHKGTGVRWRSIPAGGGKDSVMEITAWYDRLGYEYKYIDGAPFRESRGRLRLQEVVEGTIVQWTFNYEPGGMFGGLLDTLGAGRGFQDMMENSLQKLYTQMKNANSGAEYRESKSLMRDGPDVEARSTYKPRHPSALTDDAAVSATVKSNPVIVEPPLAEDDTRPRPAVEVPAASNEQEPAFLANVPNKLNTEEVRQYMRPASETQVLKDTPAVETTPVSRLHDTTTEIMPAVTDTPETVETSKVALEPAQSTINTKETVSVSVENTETKPPTENPPVSPSSAPTVATIPPVSPEEASKPDTSKISVFDVFGMQRPSETQESQAVAAAPTAQQLHPVIYGVRTGLRIVLRRKRFKHRLP